jgi:hypothetical protein
MERSSEPIHDRRTVFHELHVLPPFTPGRLPPAARGFFFPGGVFK